jgi:hypothetical protein
VAPTTTEKVAPEKMSFAVVEAGYKVVSSS